MPTFDSPVGWPPGERGSYVSTAYTTAHPVTCPQFRAMNDGYKAAILTSILMACAGKGANRTIRYYFGSQYSASTALASSGAAVDHALAMNYNIAAGAGVNFGIESNGAFYIGTDSGSSTPVAARFTYIQCPTAPQTPALGSPASAALTLTWTAPSDNGGSAVTGYRVQIAEDAAFTVGVQSFNGVTGGTKTFTGLKSSTKYYARVFAQNAVTTTFGRYGPSSAAVSADTLAGVPTAPPSLVATAQSSTVTKLDWTVPTSDGGSAITNYDVDYSQSATFASGVTSVPLGNVLTYTTPALAIGTWYFRVRARNVNGPGAYSSVASNVVSAILGYIKVLLSGAQTKKPVKVYVGGTFVQKPLKVYAGGVWKVIN